MEPKIYKLICIMVEDDVETELHNADKTTKEINEQNVEDFLKYIDPSLLKWKRETSGECLLIHFEGKIRLCSL